MAAAYISNLRRQFGLTIPPKWARQPYPFSTAAPAVSAARQREYDRDGRSTWSKVFLFVPGAITFGLGTWQIIRRQEQIKILEYRQSRLGMEPLKGNQIVPSSGNLDSLEFRRIQCKGVFDEKKSIYIGPRSRSISGVIENGYYLITPLAPIPGDPQSVQSCILVNRGWVPRTWRDKALSASEDEEKVSTSPFFWSWRFWSKKPQVIEDHLPANTNIEKVIGVVRDSEIPSIFVPSNDPYNSQWFYVDVPVIACACGLPEETLYVEDINENINPSRPYPIPKEVNTLIHNSVMPRDHLIHILTWYGLSAAVTFMAIKRLKPVKSLL